MIEYFVQVKPDPKESNRVAAFWSVLGVVTGLIVFLTLSDLPWSDIFTAIGCSCHRLTCCFKKDPSQSNSNSHLRFSDSPTNDNNAGVQGMRASYASDSSDPHYMRQKIPTNVQYNGYRSPDHTQIPQMGEKKTISYVNTNEPRSKSKDPVDSMVNWTQQLQEQLKSKKPRETSASSTKQLIHSTDSYHH